MYICTRNTHVYTYTWSFKHTLESTVSWDVVLMLPTFLSSCSLSVTSSISFCILSVAFFSCSNLCSACNEMVSRSIPSFIDEMIENLKQIDKKDCIFQIKRKNRKITDRKLKDRMIHL